MTLYDSIRDHADHMSMERPETLSLVGTDPIQYSGTGNPCQQIAITLSGLSREDRLKLIASVFELRALTSMKQLTVAQLLALLRFRESLGENREVPEQF